MMIWYVALVALVNLALGYALAVMLGSKRSATASVSGSTESGDLAEF